MVANTDSTPPTCPCSNTLRKPDNINTEQSAYHKHWTAQKLNNQAASFIDVGCYDKAVALLVDALCLSPLSASKTSSPACPCSQCTLEECIAYSEERASSMKLRKQQKQRIVGKKRSIDGVVINNSSSSADTQPDDDEPQEGYIHKRPIRVTPTTIREGHAMGSTLSLIVTFNLALANHLKALTYKDSFTTTNACSRTRDTLRKVLRLYELAYKWQAELSQPQQQPRNETVTTTTSGVSSSGNEATNTSVASTTTSKQAQPSSNNEANTTSSNNNNSSYCTSNSLRFDMIVCNNLSQIHKMANNSLKQEKCLEHLLSIILFVVDWQRESSGQQQHHHHQETEGPPRRRRRLESTASSSSDRCEDQEDEEEDDAFVVQKRKSSPKYMDLDGFLHNVAPLVLKNQCATAA